MTWFRRWLSPVRRHERCGPPRPTFRPRVEALEVRNLLNVSSVFDSAGSLVQFAVYQGGSLVRYDSSGGHVLADSGVRVAHGFRDTFGRAAVDIVYSSGAAVEYDSTGGHLMAASGVLDMSRAYDAFGNFKLDVVYDTTGTPPFGPDLQGTLIEYTNTTATKLADNVRWANVYLDKNGGLGNAVGIISGGNLLAYRNDTTGSFLLYNSPDGATQDVTDYGQAEDLNGNVWVDVTLGRFAGTYTLESQPTGVVTLGTGSSIQVGG